MTKTYAFFAALLVSTFSPMAFAGETYSCVGKVGAQFGEATITIEFEDLRQAQVTDFEGTEYLLDFSKVNSQGKVFADYGYDGYGGSVELTVPQSFQISGSDATEEFEVKFQVETYSEIGHVQSMTYTGSCERIDN